MTDLHSAPPFTVPGNLPKRLAVVLCGLVALFTVPFTLLAVAVAAFAAIDKGPGVLLDLLQVLPCAAIGVGAVYFGVRLDRELKEEKLRAQEDALRAEARAQSRGTLVDHARRVAGPSPAGPSPAAPSPPLGSTGGGRQILPQTGSSRPASHPPAGGPFPIDAGQVESVRCTWCGTRVSAALGDPSSGQVTCPSCSTTFSMRSEMHKAMGMRPKPLGLDVTSRTGTLTIAHVTNPGAGCGLSMLAGVALLLTVPHGLNMRDWVPTAAVACVFVGVVVVTHLWRARRTEYEVSEGRVTARITGFLRRVLGTWDAREVDQVFVRQRERTRTERHPISKRKHRVTELSWDVILRETNQGETRLAKDLGNLDWALFIEQEIENHLGVVDWAVGDGPQR